MYLNDLVRIREARIAQAELKSRLATTVESNRAIWADYQISKLVRPSNVDELLSANREIRAKAQTLLARSRELQSIAAAQLYLVGRE